MSFNFLPQFPMATAPESQLAEGGANAFDNCGPACGSVLMQALGYQDIEPQDWTNYEYGTAYHGGETVWALNDFIRTHYHNPPAMLSATSGNPALLVQQYAAQGFVCIGLFHSDAQAHLKNADTGILHFCLVLAFNGDSFTVWNPWHGTMDTVYLGSFNLSCTGLLDVCQRNIQEVPPMTFGEKQALVICAFQAGLGLTPDTQQQIDDNANEIADDGHNAGNVVAKIITSPQGLEYRKKIAALLAAGPAAVSVPAVDVSKFSQKGHKHAGGETGPDT